MKIKLISILSVLLVVTSFTAGCDYVTGKLPESEPHLILTQEEINNKFIPMILTTPHEPGEYNIVYPELSLKYAEGSGAFKKTNG
jgi:hypothetical protein